MPFTVGNLCAHISGSASRQPKPTMPLPVLPMLDCFEDCELNGQAIAIPPVNTIVATAASSARRAASIVSQL
jgi:hypothetical protein